MKLRTLPSGRVTRGHSGIGSNSAYDCAARIAPATQLGIDVKHASAPGVQ